MYPIVRDRLPTSLQYARETSGGVSQSASQLSAEEFAQVDSRFTPDRLRSFAGDPTSKTGAEVEGVRLECWYYGIAGADGAYQICFENGRLSTKTRFARG